VDRLSPAIIEAARRHCYAQITHVDYELGRLFGELQSQQLWQDTAVLFASDHGELLGDHISFHKSFFYEPSARVPLLLRVPQRHGPPAAAGAVIAEPALLADIYATCLALAGVGSDEPEDGAGTRDGVSLAGTPHAPAGRAEGRWVFGFCGAAHGRYMATNGRWMYLYYAWGGAAQLFDLERDPAERHDLAAAGAPDGDARGALEEGRERLRRAVPCVAVPDGGDARRFHVMDEPLPDEAAARASNPFAWRGPIRYGGHW
jgi:arylsulfatase